jgi:hypothetical protein
MNKICTDIKQSRKLIELGIDINTADMCYMYRHWEIDENTVGAQSDAHIGFDSDVYYGADNGKTYHYIPAWSLSALMNLLPSEFIEVGKYSTTTYLIHIRKYKFTDEVNLHQIAYGSYKWYEDGSNSWKDMINTGEKEDLLDAAFEMVCWLKENKKI